jgi:hypothetical protein
LRKGVARQALALIIFAWNKRAQTRWGLRHQVAITLQEVSGQGAEMQVPLETIVNREVREIARLDNLPAACGQLCHQALHFDHEAGVLGQHCLDCCGRGRHEIEVVGSPVRRSHLLWHRCCDRGEHEKNAGRHYPEGWRIGTHAN